MTRLRRTIAFLAAGSLVALTLNVVTGSTAAAAPFGYAQLNSIQKRLASGLLTSELGGLQAKTFDLTNTINMDDCRTSPFNQWTFRNEAGVAVGNGTSSGPGDHQRIWVLDVDGQILLVNADTGANDSPDDVSELFEIVDGLRIE